MCLSHNFAPGGLGICIAMSIYLVCTPFLVIMSNGTKYIIYHILTVTRSVVMGLCGVHIFLLSLSFDFSVSHEFDGSRTWGICSAMDPHYLLFSLSQMT